MKKLYLILIMALTILAYLIGGYVNQPNEMFIQGVDSEMGPSPLPVPFNIPQEYFDFDVLSNRYATSYVEMGEMPSSDVSDVRYTTEVVQYDENNDDEYGYDPIYRDIDIDNDGIDELIIIKTVAMTQSPHIIEIVKDGQVIFESISMSRISIAPSTSKNGFYLRGTPGEEIGTGYRVIRFMWIDGELKPVWQQKISYLTVE